MNYSTIFIVPLSAFLFQWSNDEQTLLFDAGSDLEWKTQVITNALREIREEIQGEIKEIYYLGRVNPDSSSNDTKVELCLAVLEKYGSPQLEEGIQRISQINLSAVGSSGCRSSCCPGGCPGGCSNCCPGGCSSCRSGGCCRCWAWTGS